MRRLCAIVLGIALLVIPATAAAAPPAGSCDNIAGMFLGQAVPTATGFDVYIVDLSGPLAGQAPGTKLVTVTVQKVTPGGTVHFTGVHEFAATDFGPLTTHDKGMIAPNGQVHNTLSIVEGGSGSISVRGTADLSTGVVDVRYHGRVCVA